MTNLNRGFLAGFIATIALSILMLIKSALGMLPQLNAIQMLSGITANLTGTQPSIVLGWLEHLVIGIFLWGGLFSLVQDKLPAEDYWARGVLFGVGAWVLMMLIVMPIAGAGLFGFGIGLSVPIATLILHLIYGAVLGWGYSLAESHDPQREGAIVPETTGAPESPGVPESPIDPSNPESPLRQQVHNQAPQQKQHGSVIPENPGVPESPVTPENPESPLRPQDQNGDDSSDEPGKSGS